jgi:hypothetical protein
MWMRSASPDRERSRLRALDLVMRTAVVLALASGATFMAVAIFGVDSNWTLVALGEAFLALALLSQI